MKMLIFVLAAMIATGARAQDVVEKTVSATSKSTNPAEARREIQDLVSQQVTEELAKELLGEDRFQKNRSLVMSKIVKSSGRFIPFLKPGALQQTGDGYMMSVTLKANVSSLRQVLQENGLLNENTTAPILLPLVSFTDRANLQTDRWWIPGDAGSKGFLRTLGRQFEAAMRSSFRKGGFYVVRPQTAFLTPSVPRGLRSESPGPEDLQLLGDWFGAPLVIGGSVNLSKNPDGTAKIEVKIDVVQTSNNRPVADLARTYTTEAGTFETVVEKKWREVQDTLAGDLSSQVVDAWQKGSIGSSLLRLVLEPRPTLPEIESLKEKLKSSSAGVRSVRERLISSNSLVFEVDSPVGAGELAGRLKGFDFNGKKFETSVENEKTVHVRWDRGGGTP